MAEAMPRFGRKPTFGEAKALPRQWRRRYRYLRILLLVTLALVVAIAFVANTARQKRMREQGSFTRSDSLSKGDHRFPDGGGIFDGWSVTMTIGQTLRVAVKTADLPAQFHIVGPMESDTPAIVQEGDAVAATEATAEFSPSQAGEYVVVVRSGGAYGSYQMTTNYRTSPLGSSSDETESAVDVIGVVFVLLLLVQYAGLPTFLIWTHPDRILLLRPFEEAQVSRALKKLNRRALAHRGFTFTLADKHLQNSFLVFLLANVPVDLGSLLTVWYRPLFRRMHRRVFIQRPRDLGIVRLRLRSRWALTTFWQSWLGFGDRINKFGSRDDLWKECIDFLLDDCQVIVVDMTRVGEGTLWELRELLRRHDGYKSLFVVRGDEADEAKAKSLLQQLGDEYVFEPPTIHRYDYDGRLVNERAFDDAYGAAVASEQQRVPRKPPDEPQGGGRDRARYPVCAGVGPDWFTSCRSLPSATIRREKGLLRGEVLAHLAVVLYTLVLIADLSFLLVVLLR